MTSRELETRLGYSFTQQDLLTQALTHRSFGVPHNERLEFLGDSVLNCAVARLLYDQSPAMAEGDLSRMRANLVNQTTLARIAADLGLGDMLRLGEGEIKTGGAARASILADALEALFGAIFLDAGFDRSAAVVKTLFSPLISSDRNDMPAKDAKTALQEWLQARHLQLPQYEVVSIEGAPHRQIFHMRCLVASQNVVTQGQGPSRRIAEQDAAAQAMANIAMLEKAQPK